MLYLQGQDGFIYRDTKFENTTFNTVTGQIKIIDYGLATLVDKFDFHEGFTPGWFTPEMVGPEDNFRRFFTSAGQFGAVNTTTDVFLIGKAGLEMIGGLPEDLQPPYPYDRDNVEAVETMLYAHHRAPYSNLIKRIHSPQARSFLKLVMAINPRDRRRPVAALHHPFLAARAAAVHARVGETLLEYTQQVCHILDWLAPLQDQSGVFLAAHHQELLQYLQAAMNTAAGTSDVQHDSVQAQQEDASNSISGFENDVAALTDDVSASTDDVAAPTTSSVGVSHTTSLDRSVSAGVSSSFTATDSATTLDASKAKQWLSNGLLKAYKRLKSFNSGTSSQKQDSSPKVANSSDTAAIISLAAGDDAVVVIEPVGVSVPGFCGLRLFGGRTRVKGSSKTGSLVGSKA